MSLPRPPPLPLRCFGLAFHCVSCKQASDEDRGSAQSFRPHSTTRASSAVRCACGSDIRRVSDGGAEQVHLTALDTEGKLTSYKTLEIPAHTRLRMMVEARGINISRPKILNRISPGKRPKPSFCSHGVSALMSSSAKKTTMSQRVMWRLTTRTCGHLVQSPWAPTRWCRRRRP